MLIKVWLMNLKMNTYISAYFFLNNQHVHVANNSNEIFAELSLADPFY